MLHVGVQELLLPATSSQPRRPPSFSILSSLAKCMRRTNELLSGGHCRDGFLVVDGQYRHAVVVVALERFLRAFNVTNKEPSSIRWPQQQQNVYFRPFSA